MMRLQHETSLIQAGSTINMSALMGGQQSVITDQFTSVASFNPIEYCCWSHVNSSTLCVYLTGQNQVLVFDSKSYDKKEKFSLKPIDKKYSRSSFTVKGFQFSPDGTRLAIGQSDCIIYIYKLGTNATLNNQQQQQQPGGPNSNSNNSGGQLSNNSQQSQSTSIATRPTITGKFSSSSPITCLVWNEAGLIFGTQDGKVKMIATSSPDQQQQQQSTAAAPTNNNKVTTVMAQQSLVIAIVCSNSTYLNDIIVVGFLNGAVLLASNLTGSTGSNESQKAQIQTSQLLDHSCAPFALCLTSNNYICIGGSDGKFFIGQIHQDLTSGTKQIEPYVKSEQIIDLRSEIQKIDCSPSGDIILACVANKILLIKLDSKQLWRICYSVTLKNALMISSLVWSPDGSQVIAGTLSGALELFSCQWNGRNINDRFEINYLAKNHIIIKNFKTQQLCANVKSQFDIDNIKLVMDGQFAVIWTTHTLVLVRLADSQTESLRSELNWSGMSKQNLRFCFDYNNVVAIALAGEIMIVELGTNSIMFSVRSDYANRHLISLKGFEQKPIDRTTLKSSAHTNKLLFCYLVDAKSLSVIDLKNKLQLCSWTNSVAIDWLELSDSGSGLLFRDRSLQLYLLKLNQLNNSDNGPARLSDNNVAPTPWSTYQLAQSINCVKLIKPCTFAQWICGTNVIVAQSSYKIYIWYDLVKPVIYDARNVPVTGSLRGSVTSSAAVMMKPQMITRNYPDIVSIEREHQTASCNTRILLSNGGSIELDMIFIEFDTMIRDENLLAALSLLEPRTNKTHNTNTELQNKANGESSTESSGHDHKSINSLWQILADKALTLNQLNIAERALAELGEYAKCRYLRSCRQDEANCQWRLALLRNDWDSFESLADMECIKREYKKLNRWTRAISYLDRMGQYRLKDNLEREYHEWLLSKKQIVEASRQMVQSGQLFEALQLLLRNNRLKFASRLLLDHYGNATGNSGASAMSKGSSSLFLSTRFTVNNNNMDGIIAEIKNKLIENQYYEEAAQLCESKLLLNLPIEALELYTKASIFSKAISLARDHCPERVVYLEERYGDYILSSDGPSSVVASKSADLRDNTTTIDYNQAQPKTAAIDHYIEAGKLEKALQAAMELHQYDKAAQILPSMDFNESIVDYCKQLGDYHRSKGLTEEAVSFYKLGRHNKSAIDTYLDKSQFTKAYQLATELMPNDKNRVDEMFKLVAENLVNDSIKQLTSSKEQHQQLMDAEKIYLMLGKIDEAIEMYKASRQYEQMVKLIRDYHPDLLENSLIMLAGELESQGELDKAERYYLMASGSEWKNVVRMYRNGQKWSDAYRVCVSHEPDDGGAGNQRVQMAYWWSKSLASVEDSVRLLAKLDSVRLINQVLQYAVENRNFEYALELIEAKEYRALEGDTNSEQLKSRILLKYASWLEQQGKFNQAEKLLTEGGHVTEAVEMYIESGMFSDALRLAELHPQLKYKTDDNEKECPLMEKVLLSQVGQILKAADVDQLSQLGNNSGGKRSMMIDALNQAQQLYLRANRPDLAVEMYRSRSMWQEALQVARKFAPNLLTTVEQNNNEANYEDYTSISASQTTSDLYELLENNNNNNSIYSNHGLTTNSQSVPTSGSSSDTMATTVSCTGNMQNYSSQINKLDSGIDIVHSRGSEQDELDATIMEQISLAIDRDERLHVKRLLCRHVANLISSNEWDRSLNCVNETGRRASYIYSQQEVLSVILRLSSSVMTACPWGVIEDNNTGYNNNDVIHLWFTLRDLLWQTRLNNSDTNNINDYSRDPKIIIVDSLHRHLMAAHYVSLHYSLMEIFREQQELIRKGNLDEASYGIQHSVLGLLASISIALLRYSDIVSVDRAFYVAGLWCSQAKRLDLAYIYWKHLLELLEAIESKSLNSIDNELFKNTDIPILESLPQHQFDLAANVREQVQDWVLQNLLTFDTDPKLPLDSRGIYEASLQKQTKARPATANKFSIVDQYPSCLISGYPVLEISQSIDIKLESNYAVRRKDWNTFVSLLRRSTQRGEQLLSRVMDFISSLAGKNREAIEEYKF